MKANELRIGYYYNKGGNYPECLFKMDSKTLSNILDVGGEGEFEPIPLTEEWLLKFGFENNKLILNNGKVWVYHYICKDIHINGCYTGANIKYVNQLQNLYFALTGEELEIE